MKRIDSLSIPPAWSDVEIARSPRVGHGCVSRSIETCGDIG
ncbi:hypothetical protein ACW5CM_12255 [Microbacterium sp. A588]